MDNQHKDAAETDAALVREALGYLEWDVRPPAVAALDRLAAALSLLQARHDELRQQIVEMPSVGSGLFMAYEQSEARAADAEARLADTERAHGIAVGVVDELHATVAHWKAVVADTERERDEARDKARVLIDGATRYERGDDFAHHHWKERAEEALAVVARQRQALQDAEAELIDGSHLPLSNIEAALTVIRAALAGGVQTEDN